VGSQGNVATWRLLSLVCHVCLPYQYIAVKTNKEVSRPLSNIRGFRNSKGNGQNVSSLGLAPKLEKYKRQAETGQGLYLSRVKGSGPPKNSRIPTPR